MARRKKQNEEQSQENIENTDDTFGLPEIEYEPINRDKKEEEPQEQSEPVADQSQSSSYEETVEHTSESQPEYEHEHEDANTAEPVYEEDDDDQPSVWPKVLGILLLLIVVGGAAYWYFGIYRPKQLAEEKARQEQIAKEEDRKREEARLAEEKRLADEQRRADSLAAAQTPKTGAIETLSERTGRYYVIVASSIDGDLIMDYAKKLSPQGVSTKIIPPHGKVKFYRLAVADGDTYASTQTTADGLKSDYGGAVWVVRY
ncbi:MAG: hypothetical protein ACOYXT_18130 [Bacteroidota bacterium]